jgi:uncharacterized protein (DUF305 family)
MNKYLASGLILIAFILGVSLGYVYTPNYKMGIDTMVSLGPAGKTFDLNYLNKMASHHKGAILLAEQVKNQSQRPEIKALAEEILSGEPKLISQLLTWKKDWYKDSSGVVDPQVVNLGSYDSNLDLRFLNALIAHHEEGVLMAKEASAKSTRNEVLTDASNVANFLTNSAVMLKAWRSEWYGVK